MVTCRNAERFVIEPVPYRMDVLGWQGVLWQARCPECGWTSEPHRHPIDAGLQVHEHTEQPWVQVETRM